MRAKIAVVLLVGLTVSGCARVAESRLNPLNWFGNAESVVASGDRQDIRPLVPPGRKTIVVDSRSLVSTVSSLRIDRTPDGAIIHATGQTTGSGYFNAELVPVSTDGSTLTLAFRASAPGAPKAGTQVVTAAYVIPASQLPSIRRVQVQSATNTLSSAR